MRQVRAGNGGHLSEKDGGARGLTHLVTTLIFTPKTPDCFRDGILFRLNSLLVNFMESFTEI